MAAKKDDAAKRIQASLAAKVKITDGERTVIAPAAIVPVVEKPEEPNDPTVLLVSGSRGREIDREYVKKLAKAAREVYAKHKIIRMRCVGAGALNNAEKAFILMREEALRDGVMLLSRSQFTTVRLGDAERTGIVKEIQSVTDWSQNKPC